LGKIDKPNLDNKEGY